MVQVSVARAAKVVVPPRRISRYLVSITCMGVVLMVTFSMLNSFFGIVTKQKKSRHGLLVQQPGQTPRQKHQSEQSKPDQEQEQGDGMIDAMTQRREYPIPLQEKVNGTDVLFVEPIGTEKIKGILFVAHGCSHSHTDWFLICYDDGEDQKGCHGGLPEERAIVVQALELGLVVVAVSSVNRITKCWNPKDDIERIGTILQHLTKRYESRRLPVFLFGASSGGAFVSVVATPLIQQYDLNVVGFISQIAAVEIPPTMLEIPCRVYITMNNDQHTDGMAASLASVAVPSSKSLHLRLPPLPIQSDYFSLRIPEITLEQSTQMVTSLKRDGLLDDSGYLLDSPRRSNWRTSIQPILPISGLERDRLTADQSPISEVMNVAEGVHELTRDGVKDALEFCLLLASGTSSRDR